MRTRSAAMNSGGGALRPFEACGMEVIMPASFAIICETVAACLAMGREVSSLQAVLLYMDHPY